MTSLLIIVTSVGVSIIAEVACAVMWIRREIQHVRDAIHRIYWVLEPPSEPRKDAFNGPYDLFVDPDEFDAKLDAAIEAVKS